MISSEMHIFIQILFSFSLVIESINRKFVTLMDILKDLMLGVDVKEQAFWRHDLGSPFRKHYMFSEAGTICYSS